MLPCCPRRACCSRPETPRYERESEEGIVAVDVQARPTLDVLIRNGRVADGTGNPLYPADVAIQGDRIVSVGHLPAGTAALRVIDATGKIVCPGFVDCHSHSDRSILANPTAQSTIRQGITTEIVGNCGGSYAPDGP